MVAVARLQLRAWWDAALNFIYPPVCQICGRQRTIPAQGFVCQQCRLGVRWVAAPFCDKCGQPFEGEISNPFDCANCRETSLAFRFARSAVVADELVLEIIHRYKYNGALWFEPFLAGLLTEAAGRGLTGHWDMIIPVPLHPVKKREREFNQAERLAGWLGAACQIPVKTKVLRRIRATATQTHLGRRERAANVQAAFAVAPGQEPAGKRIILVDDVLTTGATTSACAKALQKAGAVDVCVWTVARGA